MSSYQEKKSWKKEWIILNMYFTTSLHQIAIYEGWFHWSKKDSWQLVKARSLLFDIEDFKLISLLI